MSISLVKGDNAMQTNENTIVTCLALDQRRMLRLSLRI